MVIRSVDDVLRAPKRIHSVEYMPGSKVALWKPVPWIGFLYFVIVELVFIIAAKLPGASMLADAAGPLVYYLLLPGLAVWAALNVELDGRSPHRWTLAYARFLTRPNRTLAGRPVPPAGTRARYAGRVRAWFDLTSPRLHHGWVKGGTVSTSRGARFTYALRHRAPVLRPDPSHARADRYPVTRLEIRP